MEDEVVFRCIVVFRENKDVKIQILFLIKVIRFRDDPEWDDVEPIPLNDDEQGAVRISTTDAFNDAFMYLRALLQTNEISERAFKLTDR